MAVAGEARVIVIGSGPTGAMAALTLTQQGVPVTLLESGQSAPPGLLVRALGRTLYRKWPSAPASWPHVVAEDPKTLWFHDEVPGGLSTYWTGAVPRFAPEDFTEGERLDARYRWPIGYADLRPYYERVERLMLVAGGQRDFATLPAARVAHPSVLPPDWRRLVLAAQAHGQGFASTPLAEGGSWMVARRGAPFNSFDVIIERLRREPGFQLVLGAHALRLEWSGDQRRVTSVIYYDRATGSERRLDAAAVVVAAGPLNSTKLLLQSTSADFPDGLGNSHGILGTYLHDHPQSWCIIGFDRPMARLGHTAYLTRAAYHDASPLRAASCTIGNVTALDRVLALTPTKTQRFGVTVFASMIPLAEHRVFLDATRRDEFGLPQLGVRIHFDDAVRPTIEQALARLLTIAKDAGCGATLQSEVFHHPVGSSVHYGGSVRMHASPEYGMLDGWNRLHAVPNVVVADASSFTTGVEKNPTLTAMALAARAAERLAADLKTM